MTFPRRQTAYRMRHCFARRIDECPVRRELLRTSTRSAERYPQGVCRIRKAAEPPTAAQQRMIEAEANRLAVLTRQRRAQAVPFRRHKSRSSPKLPIKAFLLGFQRGYSLLRKRISPLPAPLRVRRDSRFVLTNNFSHGMLTTTKGSEKEAFSFHPLKRGDGRCKSLRNGKGGAFEPRGGNAAPVPPLQGNEVPRIQRGIQVEPRTMICSP